MMLKIVYVDVDRALAERIMRDLAAELSANVEDMRLDGAAQARGDILLLVLSPTTWADKSVKNIVYQALDNMQHIIPILAQMTKLPHVVDHLQPVDFSQKYDLAELKSKIDYFSSPDAPAPLRVLTPSRRRSNWRVGAVFIALAFSMFCIGILAIGGGVSRPPQAEYDAVATAIQGTVDMEIAAELAQYMLFLPRSTEAAANYPATLQQVPTRYRPFMAETATGVALATMQPTATPTPDPALVTPGS